MSRIMQAFAAQNRNMFRGDYCAADRDKIYNDAANLVLRGIVPPEGSLLKAKSMEDMRMMYSMLLDAINLNDQVRKKGPNMIENVKKYMDRWVGDAPHTPRNVIAVIIKGFGPLVPNHEELTKTAAVAIELHAISITGLLSGLEFQFNGEHMDLVHRHHGTIPVIGYADRYGQPIKELHRHWMQDLLLPIFKDHDDINEADPYFIDSSLEVLFFEPDPTHTVVVDAWYCKNFYPVVAGTEGQRDLRRELGPTLSVKYSATTEQGDAVMKLALETLTGFNLAAVNPYERAALVERIVSETHQGKQSR